MNIKDINNRKAAQAKVTYTQYTLTNTSNMFQVNQQQQK